MNKFRDALSASLSNFAAEIKKKYCHVQENVVEEIKVNGTAQTVSDKSVNISVPTNVSELANDSKYQTDEQVAAIIAAKVSS